MIIIISCSSGYSTLIAIIKEIIVMIISLDVDVDQEDNNYYHYFCHYYYQNKIKIKYINMFKEHWCLYFVHYQKTFINF